MHYPDDPEPTDGIWHNKTTICKIVTAQGEACVVIDSFNAG